MSKFRAAPRLQSETAFVQGAEAPRKPVSMVAAPVVADDKQELAPQTMVAPLKKEAPVLVNVPAAGASPLPWEQHDASAKATVTTQPLRLNAYQHEQLKWLAEREDRSFAQILRRIVGPALEEAVRSQQE